MQRDGGVFGKGHAETALWVSDAKGWMYVGGRHKIKQT